MRADEGRHARRRRPALANAATCVICHTSKSPLMLILKYHSYRLIALIVSRKPCVPPSRRSRSTATTVDNNGHSSPSGSPPRPPPRPHHPLARFCARSSRDCATHPHPFGNASRSLPPARCRPLVAAPTPLPPRGPPPCHPHAPTHATVPSPTHRAGRDAAPCQASFRSPTPPSATGTREGRQRARRVHCPYVQRYCLPAVHASAGRCTACAAPGSAACQRAHRAPPTPRPPPPPGSHPAVGRAGPRLLL